MEEDFSADEEEVDETKLWPNVSGTLVDSVQLSSSDDLTNNEMDETKRWNP